MKRTTLLGVVATLVLMATGPWAGAQTSVGLALPIESHVQPADSLSHTPPPQDTVTTSALRPKRSLPSGKANLAFHPFPLLASNFMLSYQHAVSKTVSLVLNVGVGFAESSNFYSPYGAFTDTPVSNMFNFRVQGQGRMYMTGQMLNGLYLGAYLMYKQLRFEEEFEEWDPINGLILYNPQEYSMSAFSGGILVGYQLLAGRFTLDTYLGGGPTYANGDYEGLENKIFDGFRRGMGLNGGFSVGVKLF